MDTRSRLVVMDWATLRIGVRPAMRFTISSRTSSGTRNPPNVSWLSTWVALIAEYVFPSAIWAITCSGVSTIRCAHSSAAPVRT